MSKIEEIRSRILAELPQWDQPSLAVGIVKDGEVVLNEGFGMADPEKGLASNADTIYQIGSSSKAFTATAVAILVDQGKVSWDEPARTYLPWLKFQDDYTSEHVTVRDLLCHRTGLPRHDAYWIDGPCTRQGMVENLRNMQAAWSFRSHWCYQNTCIVAAGMVVEAVSGMTWEEFVTENILKPLGMTRTTFYIDAIKADENHAAPCARIMPTDLNGYHAIDFLKSDVEDLEKGIGAPYGPAGSIASTVNDMCKWLQFNLSKGKVGETQLVSEENMAEIHKSQMLLSEPLIVPFPEEDFYSYGLCWFIETFRGHKMIEHGGNINGFSCLVTLVPDMELGIITMANFDNSFNTYATSLSVIDSYLGIEDGDWHNRWREIVKGIFAGLPDQIEAMNGPATPNTTPSHDLEAYVGTYTNTCYGDMTIELKDGELWLTYNKGVSNLYHFHYDTFRIENPHHLFYGTTFNFLQDKKGNISAIEFDATMDPHCKPEIFTKQVEA